MQRVHDEILEKEAQLRAQLVVIHQKDSEISRLMGEIKSQPIREQVYNNNNYYYAVIKTSMLTN